MFPHAVIVVPMFPADACLEYIRSGSLRRLALGVLRPGLTGDRLQDVACYGGLLTKRRPHKNGPS